MDGHLASSLNAAGLFNIEPLLPKAADAPDGAWEEKYNSHTDSKPHGPQSLSLDLSFPTAPALFGIPEHASSFALQRTVDASGEPLSEPYRLYNLDVYEYLANSTFGLYGSIPFLLAHSPGDASVSPSTVGVFWHNSAEQFVDVHSPDAGSAVHWWAESGTVDLFFLAGRSAGAVWRQYARLTGAPQLPPLWALGYHQCRWNYKDEADVLAVDAGFDEHDLPYDVIWLDIEHTDGKRYMTWDSRHFPQPAALQEKVYAHGERRTVTIIDPHVKRDDGFHMHAEATRLGLYVKTADGSKDFEGWCWPGSSSYLDVTSPAIREWWADQFSFDRYAGSTEHLAVWNDMNEPSVFNGPEVTMQKDLTHFGGWEHRDVHNLYGLHYHAATQAGLQRRSPHARPFVLSRAFFAGSQRYGAIWTGDNAAQWSHLAVSIPMVLSVSSAGLPFAGADVGGFFGNPSAELLVRWYQLGVYYPFFRGHAHHDTARREPWLHGEPYTSYIKAALRERYALLPYLYTLFAASAGYSTSAFGAWMDGADAAGTPVARPLWSEFPSDAHGLGIEHQMMLGPALLVCPVLSEGADTADCYLPRGAAGEPPVRWFEASSGVEHPPGWLFSVPAPLSLPAPVFLRGGTALLRRERARRSTGAQRGDPYTLLVSLDSTLSASGEQWLDDGVGSEVHGSRRHFAMAPDGGGRGFVLTCSGVGPQAFESDERLERIAVLGLPPSAGGYSAVLADDGGSHVQLEGGFVKNDGVSGPAAALVLRAPHLGVARAWSVLLAPRE